MHDTAGAQQLIQTVREEYRDLGELSPTAKAELDLLEQEQLVGGGGNPQKSGCFRV